MCIRDSSKELPYLYTIARNLCIEEYRKNSKEIDVYKRQSPQYYRTDDTPEKRTARQKEYIKTVRELQTVLSDVRTVEDAAKAYDRFFVDNGYLEKVQGWGWGSGIHYRATKKGQDNPVITNKLSNTMLIRSAEYFERNFTQKAKKEQFCVSKEQKIPKGYAIHFNDGKHTYSKNEDLLSCCSRTTASRLSSSAVCPCCLWAVSYTHLDVYKRQACASVPNHPAKAGSASVVRPAAGYRKTAG